MTRYEIDPRLKADVPDQYLTDLIRPVLKRFENIDGDVTINEEGVRFIKRELREIYRLARDFQEALSQARCAAKNIADDTCSREDDELLLEAFRAENVVLFPLKEETT